MDGWFWILFAVPVLWPFISKAIWRHKITWVEMGLNLVIVCIVVIGVWFAGQYSGTSDVEVWNGQVTDKQKLRVSCGHSYECFCTEMCSGSGSNRTCTRVCQTCYEHQYDIDWRVMTDIGDFNIRRIDRQGLREPERWSAVEIGDPVADTHSYTNWVKAVPESLFHDESNLAEKYKDFIPEYPLDIYDYHYLDRVIPVGLEIPNLEGWNLALAEELKWLGPNKQANIVVVFANINDPIYAHALRNAWLGGKKNDIIIVIGITEWPNVAWADVFSWSKNDLVNVSLRDSIINMKQLDLEEFMTVLRLNVFENYIRRPMAEFEYLKDEIDPPLWAIILGLILGIGGSIGLSFFFSRDEVNIGG